MCDAQSAREAFEESWKRRLDDARAQLDFARNYVREVENDRASRRIRQSTYAEALGSERLAIEKYERVLGIFIKIVVHGEMPNEQRATFYR